MKKEIKTYTWEEINEALMSINYSPKRIADVLSALVKKEQRDLEREETEAEERFCVKCGRTSNLIEEENMCYDCAEERGRV